MDTIMSLTLGQIIGGSIGIIVLCSIFIEITPIKINPVSAFLRWLGKKVNGDVIQQVENLEKKLDTLESETKEVQAVERRIRILRFGDEVRIGGLHSKENFDQILDDIKEYKQYCDEHKDFANDKTVLTTEIILASYKKRLEKNDFL